MQKICEAEGITADETALWMLAKNAKGSVRDGLTLLDQVISFGGKELTPQVVMDVLGLSDRELLFHCFRAIAVQDRQQMLKVTQSVLGSGYDPLLFLQEFMEILRHSLLVKLGTHKVSPLEIPEAEVSELEELTQNLGEAEIQLLFDVCLSGTQQVSLSTDSGIAFEMLMFKLLFAPRLMSTQTTDLPIAHATPAVSPQPQQVHPAPTRSTTEPAPTRPAQAAPQPTAPKPQAKPAAPAPQAPPKPRKDLPWEDFVMEVKKSNGFLGALLEHTSIYREDKEVLTLGLPAKMSFLLSKLQEEKNLQRTQKFLQSVKGDSRKVEVELLGKKEAESSLSPKAKEEKAQQEKEASDKVSVESHPLVQATSEIFKGKIISIKESN